ncbi:CHAT domain-containing protein [Sorangium sp. So ce887]|uniref:CHAT domain-containing protein n=1 Tax=Sorangium sp. So ce887 TaxID=3133324 RepID=UPI003F5E4371
MTRWSGWIGGLTSLLVAWLALAASANAAEPRGAVLGPGDTTAALWYIGEDYTGVARWPESRIASHEERRSNSGRLPRDAVERDAKVFRDLMDLGAARMGSGDYSSAVPLLARALAVAERDHAAQPEDDSRRGRLAMALALLGELRMKQGDYAAAEPLLTRATFLWGEAHARWTYAGVVGALDGLARLLLAKAEYGRADALLSTLPEGKAGRDHLVLTLAELEIARAQHGRAEDRLHRLQRQSKWKCDESDLPIAARCLQDLADIHAEAGDPALARPLLERALAILEKRLGPEHPSLAAALDRLASVQLLQGAEPSEVEPLVERALSLRDRTLGKGHVGRSTSLMLRGDLALRRGDPAAAERAYRDALALREQRLGDRHPGVAEALAALGQLREEGGEPRAAEPLYRRALAIEEAAFGPGHPRVARALVRLGRHRLDQGAIREAIGLLARGADIQDRRALALLPAASEEQRTALAGALRDETDLLLSLHADSAPSDAEAARLAFTAVLRRKGVVLDAAADRIAALRDRSSPDDAMLLRQLVSVESRLADLIIRLPSSGQPGELRASIDELERKKQALEGEIGRRGAPLRIDDEPVTLDRVVAALPQGAALVELVVRRPRVRERGGAAPLAWGAPRYAAYVLHSDGRVAWADLRDAAPIDAAAGDLRRAFAQLLRDPQRTARAVDERVMQPVRALLGGARWIFLSPDGELNLVPFGALVDEQGSYLLEHSSFTYLTSGRDLLRARHHDPRRAEPGLPALVIGAPEFGDATRHARFRREAPAGATPARRSIDMRALSFPALPGTLPEATAIARRFPGAKVLTGLGATEEALKSAAHPRILHLATHGFFLPDSEHAGGAAGENPLLRAGVALASANRPYDGPEDGVLTALEASGLDLYGTQLVVLSACETGLGEVKRADGVHGLRRALVLAGAETQVMSLWKVQDRETRNLMEAYYEKLAAGGGRVEAMRQAQIEMRSRPGTAHPFYWAAFIVSGDGAALDGREVAPRPAAPRAVPSVPPGPRGCACGAAGTGAFSGSAGSGALLAAGVLVGGLRRRSAALRPRTA